MNILVINRFGKVETKSSAVIPRIGDKVDMFYDPAPIVTEVLMWPSKKRLEKLQVGTLDIEAIITVA